MKYTIAGVLYGEDKKVTVDADSETAAINKIQSKYPDFELKRSGNQGLVEGIPVELIEKIVKANESTARFTMLIFIVVLLGFVLRLAAEFIVMFSAT